jgi:hypothetical protein
MNLVQARLVAATMRALDTPPPFRSARTAVHIIASYGFFWALIALDPPKLFTRSSALYKAGSAKRTKYAILWK